MSLPPEAPISDQPPRTWRGWWLAWPKWFRIGCWAALGLALLDVAVAARIATGVLHSVKQRGRIEATGARVAVGIDYNRDKIIVDFQNEHSKLRDHFMIGSVHVWLPTSKVAEPAADLLRDFPQAQIVLVHRDNVAPEIFEKVKEACPQAIVRRYLP